MEAFNIIDIPTQTYIQNISFNLVQNIHFLVKYHNIKYQGGECIIKATGFNKTCPLGKKNR